MSGHAAWTRGLSGGLGLALAFLGSPAAHASEEPPSEEPRRRAALVLGAEAGMPLAAAGSVGVILGSVRRGENAYDTASGWLLQAEAGAGGGKLSLGRAVALLYNPVLPWAGGSLKVSLLRSWGSPWGADAEQTYAGLELDVVVLHGRLTLGGFHRVGGASESSEWLFSWGLGFGL